MASTCSSSKRPDRSRQRPGLTPTGRGAELGAHRPGVGVQLVGRAPDEPSACGFVEAVLAADRDLRVGDEFLVVGHGADRTRCHGELHRAACRAWPRRPWNPLRSAGLSLRRERRARAHRRRGSRDIGQPVPTIHSGQASGDRRPLPSHAMSLLTTGDGMNRTTRFALALLVLAVALPAALYLHQRHTYTSSGSYFSGYHSVSIHPSWEDPAALAIVIVGVAGALALVGAGPKRLPNPRATA